MIKKVSKPVKKAIEEHVASDLKNPSPTYTENQTRSLTMKVDPSRYARLSKARYEMNKTGQDILTEALDLWFIKHRC